jgi:hypothetical protein
MKRSARKIGKGEGMPQHEFLRSRMGGRMVASIVAVIEDTTAPMELESCSMEEGNMAMARGWFMVLGGWCGSSGIEGSDTKFDLGFRGTLPPHISYIHITNSYICTYIQNMS